MTEEEEDLQARNVWGNMVKVLKEIRDELRDIKEIRSDLNNIKEELVKLNEFQQGYSKGFSVWFPDKKVEK